MKYFAVLMVLLLGFSNAFAKKMFYPNIQLIVQPAATNVIATNHSYRHYTCTGNVYVFHASGSVQVDHFYAFLPSNVSSFKNIFNPNYGDPMLYAAHNIRCF